MNDALGGGLVEPLDGGFGRIGSLLVALLGGGDRSLHPRLELGAHGLVAGVTLLVLTIPFDLALDVGHEDPWFDCEDSRDRVVAGLADVPPAIATVVTPMDLSHLRDIAIVAHVDHGKSTLADRFLELTGAVDARDMRAQYLDSMELERERGITIKLQSVRLNWRDHVINIIDTPGHVDFGYEVSRSLAACDGVILLVDAAQGIEAQTLANCYLAMENNLEIVAALNKIDLPAAEPERYADEIERVLGIPAGEILRISAKSGDGVPELLDAVIDRIPHPTGDVDAPLQALIFDSHFDQYRG